MTSRMSECSHSRSLAPSWNRDEDGTLWAWCMACGKRVDNPSPRDVAPTTE